MYLEILKRISRLTLLIIIADATNLLISSNVGF